ncbi:hypothetical protein CONLIGDRAFT_634168 [Coniochaeta ligniaria NRRL 30616]|uniref:Holocytochrome c-type synthase n=1 Tax=Coniochaeta ligniaria NRRL 30616 TaxID=1408157 RepID=A0A1J7J3H7_9PEZI|nr:hypothetical protein CONLIGDRAFT_634168 [Coniochaeta ligniaria NRRL 30616]
MHLNDLIDTILVTRKQEPTSATPPSLGSSASTTTAPAKPQPTSAMSDNAAPSSGDVCPVDHKTRELWLQQARASGASAPNPHKDIPAPNLAAQAQQTAPSQPSSSSSWSPWTWFSSSPQTQQPQPPQPQTQQPAPKHNPDGTLDTTRTISSIPRAPSTGPSACPSPSPSSPSSPAAPANHERETGADKASGNWIYPSEQMFFDAMRRKGFNSTQVSDMKTVVPIHNAVNERAWAEIKAWEAPYTTPDSCAAGPRLHSFAGVKEKMTPRARMKTLLGYTAPFDRHDWVVDRCGKRVEYVIDFYAGRPDAGEGKVNFYLDVRPKVNSWEGVRMRVLRGVGLV